MLKAKEKQKVDAHVAKLIHEGTPCHCFNLTEEQSKDLLIEYGYKENLIADLPKNISSDDIQSEPLSKLQEAITSFKTLTVSQRLVKLSKFINTLDAEVSEISPFSIFSIADTVHNALHRMSIHNRAGGHRSPIRLNDTYKNHPARPVILSKWSSSFPDRLTIYVKPKDIGVRICVKVSTLGIGGISRFSTASFERSHEPFLHLIQENNAAILHIDHFSAWS